MKMTQHPSNIYSGNPTLFRILLLSVALSLASCFDDTGKTTLNVINEIKSGVKNGIHNPLDDKYHRGYNSVPSLLQDSTANKKAQ